MSPEIFKMRMPKLTGRRLEISYETGCKVAQLFKGIVLRGAYFFEGPKNQNNTFWAFSQILPEN